MSRDNHIFIIKSELGAGTRGASMGPDAIKVAARNDQSQFFGSLPVTEINDMNDLLDEDTPYPQAKRIDGIFDVLDIAAQEISEVVSQGGFPIVFSGDHSVAAGTISGLKMAHPSKRLGVVWIDAHGDLHTPYTTPSGNVHGMPVSVVLAEDNLECQRNQPTEGSKEYWEKLKNIGGIQPKVLHSDVIFVSVRDTEKPEDELMARHQMKNYQVAEVREKGVRRVYDEILDRLNDCDLIYVSFDVDSMDCDVVSHGTGTPVKDGLFPEETKELLNLLAKNEKTCCIEVVEVNPCLDEKTNKMAETAWDICKSFIKELEN
ncbi:MAG: arginase [Crocinitomicaceae bacterium]|nr:arginase [Crocinitomicaceae bacterium]